ncbi:hypothetical protein [Amycolatopsis sulphurea]|nr:hypothetical protein [Amycolatopsis sulphurea]
MAALSGHVADVVGDLGERSGVGCGGAVVEVGGEVVAAGLEFLEPRP